MKLLAACAVYAVCGFLTFGYVYNHDPALFQINRHAEASVMGAFWPVYWAGYPIRWAQRTAIEVTK